MQIFVSYSRKDVEVVKIIANELQVYNIDMFIDYERLDAGENFPERLAKEIVKSDTIIFILSKDSVISRWVIDEIQYARRLEKKIIPIAIDFTTIPHALFFIEVLERLDFTDWRTNTSRPKAIEKLLSSLRVTHNTFVEPNSENRLRTKIPDLSNILPLPFEWCEIPSGWVTLEDATSLGGTKGGKHHVNRFWLTRYPITNLQYSEFENQEYVNKKWWTYSDHAIAWREQHPVPLERAFRNGLFPRTNISWYDAIAFCQWISHKSGHQITLPSEIQWQRAAQGDDERMYPWGDNFDASQCNSSESLLFRPVEITKYSSTPSIYGVADLCGNVWDWCITRWRTGDMNLDGDNRRVIKGGSWENSYVGIRPNIRYSLRPEEHKPDVGFRLMYL